MRFVIDGYNLLHAMGRLGGPVGPHGLAKARAALLGLVGSHHDDPVTIVFDARRAPAGVSADEVHGSVRVEYATREEADDRIEWLIAHDPAPKRLVVVSDDRRLQRSARRRGSPAWSCDAYLNWLEKPRPHQHSSPPEKPNAVGPVETDRWSKTFGDLEDDPAWDELFGSFEDGDGI